MPSPPAHGDPPVILIGGPARCGKSLFAAALAREIGGQVVCFDTAREKAHAAPPGRLRRIARVNACLKVIRRHHEAHDTPLIVEGVSLISRRARSARTGLQLLLFLRGYVGCHAFTLGCGDSTVEQKADAIVRYALEHQDWVHTEAGGRSAALGRLARQWAQRALEESRKLRDWSEAAGIPHLSLGSARFEEDLSRSFRDTIAHLAATGAPPFDPHSTAADRLRGAPGGRAREGVTPPDSAQRNQ